MIAWAPRPSVSSWTSWMCDAPSTLTVWSAPSSRASSNAFSFGSTTMISVGVYAVALGRWGRLRAREAVGAGPAGADHDALRAGAEHGDRLLHGVDGGQ